MIGEGTLKYLRLKLVLLLYNIIMDKCYGFAGFMFFEQPASLALSGLSCSVFVVDSSFQTPGQSLFKGSLSVKLLLWQ